MTSRRAFLASALAAVSVPRIGWAAAGGPSYLAAAKDRNDYVLCGLSDVGAVRFRVALPARGHAGAGHPHRAQAVAFARRPGDYALVIDCVAGEVLHRLRPPQGLQFNGHGAFARDGGLLITSEQRAEGSEGRLGLWDVDAGYKRLGDIPSYGIGPHDIRLMPGGQVLVVANGGIETDGADRIKLNLDTMAPNLSYVSLDGGLVAQVALERDQHKLSIRHLAVRDDGLVAFAMQWEGDPGAPWPILGLHRRGSPVVLAQTPLAETLAMKGYAGSIAFAQGGREVAITSPKGGRLQRFSETGAFLGSFSRADVCGLATHPDGLLASDGQGGLICLTQGAPRVLGRENLAWDNHMVALPRL